MTLPRYRPMLATRWREPFTDPGWLFEPKWDGIRLLVSFDGTAATLHTRSGRVVTDSYPTIAAFAADRPVVLDGELVALDEAGRPRFELIQPMLGSRRRSAATLAYMVFDCLYDGVEIVAQPIESRLAHLASLDLPAPMVRSETVHGEGEALFAAVTEQGLEGVVAKRIGSPYRPGARSPDWRKIAVTQTVRAVVGGFTPGTGGRASTFGALLLGLWASEGLRWIGSVGTGFSDADLKAIRAALDEMTVEACPFLPDPELPADATWVYPHLVAVVEFKEWTSAGRLRGPSFKGFVAEPPEVATWDVEGPG